MKKVAVVLCGSGFKDGSEVREAVGVLWALSTEGVKVSLFAPDEPQWEVVNCLTGETARGESRNQLVEAARIARGDVKSIQKLQEKDFDAVIVPGGFGAAKNLCSFAREGSQGKVHPEMRRVLEAFHEAEKPIGAVCIAPAIVGMTFAGDKFSMTLGSEGEAAQELVKLGHHHVAKAAREWHIDAENKVVTTPAYMHDTAPLHEIFEGILGMTRAVLKMT